MSQIDTIKKGLEKSGMYVQVDCIKHKDNEFGGETLQSITHRDANQMGSNMLFLYHFDNLGMLRMVKSTNKVDGVIYVHETYEPSKRVEEPKPWYYKLANALLPF